MLSNELETCINKAYHQARAGRHEFLTVEHLLLAITESPKVREILRACGAEPERLAGELTAHIDSSTPRLRKGDEREVQPTLGFQRVLQRALFHVQSSGRKEVGVANVLVRSACSGRSRSRPDRWRHRRRSRHPWPAHRPS